MSVSGVSEPRTSLSVLIRLDQRVRLEALAHQHDRSLSSETRRALDAYLGSRDAEAVSELDAGESRMR